MGVNHPAQPFPHGLIPVDSFVAYVPPRTHPYEIAHTPWDRTHRRRRPRHRLLFVSRPTRTPIQPRPRAIRIRCAGATTRAIEPPAGRSAAGEPPPGATRGDARADPARTPGSQSRHRHPDGPDGPRSCPESIRRPPRPALVHHCPIPSQAAPPPVYLHSSPTGIGAVSLIGMQRGSSAEWLGFMRKRKDHRPTSPPGYTDHCRF